MNKSEQKFLNSFLEKTRKVYGQTEYIKAYDIASDSYSWYLSIKNMISNKEFSRIAEKEIDKAYRYTASLRFRY